MANIKRISANFINGILQSFGLIIINRKILFRDYSDKNFDPIVPTYFSGCLEYLIDAPLESCRALQPAFFSFPENAQNPFVETLRQYEKGHPQSYEGSPLEKHYALWQPTNAAEAIGIDPNVTNAKLRSASALDFVFPWDMANP